MALGASDVLGASLTKRQTDVMELVCEGYSTKEIARKLVLSPGTVETMWEHIKVRLGARNMAHAAVFV